MPDWERLVAERLADSKLAPEVQRDVVVEVAAHLEECYDELLKSGTVDPDARTRAQVSDWNAFCRDIRRSKEDPMSFVRKVAMPGLAALIVALAALKLFVALLIAPGACGPDMTVAGANLEIAACIRVSADGPAYLSWLATLPLAGALAAVIARWMDARPMQRLIAAVVPALYFAAEMTVMSLVEGVFFWRIPIYWAIIPAIACAIGATAFLGDRRDRIAARPVVT